MSPDPQAFLRQSLRRHLFAGIAAIVVLFGGFGGWAATTELSGAVVAVGSLMVEGRAKAVQHPTGGVIADLRTGAVAFGSDALAIPTP
jgi:HlyD family secretion protein